MGETSAPVAFGVIWLTVAVCSEIVGRVVMGMPREIFVRGTMFGPYRIERMLGAGAFGAVYEAVNTRLDKPVALKVLHLDVSGNVEAAARFVQEAKTVAKIRHPHIVDITDVDTCESGSHQGVPYIAMEFLVGETLSSRVAKHGPMSLEAALEVMLPIVAAAQAAHLKGVVHRDIKSDNIFLTEFTPGLVHPKLLDFGIAKVRDGSLVQTIENAAIGTPAFSSPEQMTDAGRAGVESDQWSLAVTLYHCLSGQLPFDAKSGGLQAMIVRLCTADPTPLRDHRPDIDPGFETVLFRALRKLPSARYPSAMAFGAALLPYASASTRERLALEFRASVVPTLSSGSAHTSASGAAASVVASPESLTGVSSAIEPTQPARPRWAMAAAAAVTITVLGVGIGVGAARVNGRGQEATRPAAAAPVVSAPVVVTTIRTAPTEAPAVVQPEAPVVVPPTPPVAVPEAPPVVDTAPDTVATGETRRGQTRRNERRREQGQASRSGHRPPGTTELPPNPYEAEHPRRRPGSTAPAAPATTPIAPPRTGVPIVE